MSHWMTHYDPTAGEPHGTVCTCRIGRDHDGGGVPNGPEAGVRASPASGHVLRVHVDRDTAVLDVECHQPAGAYCRVGCVRPNCDAEFHPADTDHPMGTVPCLAAEWFAGDGMSGCHHPDAGREPVSDGMPVDVEWSSYVESWVWRGVTPAPTTQEVMAVPAEEPVTGLATCQMGRPGDDYTLIPSTIQRSYHVHLVRGTATGTPGPTLCGIDRFAADAAGWSMGGGIHGPGVVQVPCAGCVATARDQFPGMLPPARSVGGPELRAALEGAS